MSHVDDELAKAVEESEAVARAEEPSPVTRALPASTEPVKRNVGLLVALLVMGGGILTLVMTSLSNATVYNRSVDALMSEKATLTGRSVRVEGRLVKGSLRRRDQPCEFRFDIKNDKVASGVTLPVRFAQCIVPDTFVDRPDIDVDVQAEGTLTPQGHFEATQIFSKCPSKYDMKDRAGQGQKAPHKMPAGSTSVSLTP